MMRFATLLLGITALAAQPSGKAGLMKLTDQLDAAIQAGDWTQAAQISRTLKGAVQGARNQSLSAAGSELADAILGWLPVDTMTLLVAQEPFSVKAEDERNIPSALDMARGYVLALLGSAEKGNLLTALKGRTVRLAAIAIRFGEEPDDHPAPNSPTPLGMVPYQGCGVYAFAEQVGESIFGRPPDDSILGHRVWTSRGSQNDTPDRETYLVAFIEPDMLMACNDREFFEQLANRMGAAAQPRALPARLLEWKYVDRSVPLWGICHYSEKTAMLVAGITGGKDPGATGITVEFGLPSGAARARMIAKSAPWRDLAGSPDFGGAAKSREAASGVWELSIEGKPEAASMAAFALMAYLGFVVLV